MRRILPLFVTFLSLAVMPALAAKSFAPYEKAKLEALIQSGAPVIVHVHADWCPTCRRQISLFDELFADPAFSKVEAVRVNYDRDREFLAEHKVTRQATIIAFKGGREVARVVYDTNRDRIRAAIAATL
jgi:thiol-disulfide isomerase/thioredoxin